MTAPALLTASEIVDLTDDELALIRYALLLNESDVRALARTYRVGGGTVLEKAAVEQERKADALNAIYVKLGGKE